MEEKEFSKYTDEFYKGDVNWDKDFLIETIKKNNKEDFYFKEYQIGYKEENEMLYKNRLSTLEGIRKNLIDLKLMQIINHVQENTPYHLNAIFLLESLEKILKNLENYNKYLLEGKKDENLNKPLRNVFETLEDEKKFYELAEDYMYAGFDATYKKCDEFPSEKHLKDIENQKKAKEEYEKKKKEFEREKEFEKLEQEKHANEIIEGLKGPDTKEQLLRLKHADFTNLYDIMNTFGFTEKQAELLMKTFDIKIDKNKKSKEKEVRLLTKEDIDMLLKE